MTWELDTGCWLNIYDWRKCLDPLLGNDREISRYVTAVTEQRLRKHSCLHGKTWKSQQRKCVFCAVRAELLCAGQLMRS
jgi:hypothetical protein